MEFLQAALAGDPVPASEVSRMAHEHGLTPKAIRSAREALGVEIERNGSDRVQGGGAHIEPGAGLRTCRCFDEAVWWVSLPLCNSAA